MAVSPIGTRAAPAVPIKDSNDFQWWLSIPVLAGGFGKVFHEMTWTAGYATQLVVGLDGAVYAFGRNAHWWLCKVDGTFTDVGVNDPSTPQIPPGPPPTVNIDVQPASVPAGGSAALTWSSTNADRVVINGVDATKSGTEQVTPAATQIYDAVAFNINGVVSDSTALVVTAAPPPPPPTVVPTSVTFVPFATDPAAATNFGSGSGARGYGSIATRKTGTLILCGSSDGHDSHGYNGIDEITPSGVVNIRPHTIVNLGPATTATNNLLDGRGLTFWMGRDNQNMVVLPVHDGEDELLYVTDGEREPGVLGNYGVIVNLRTGEEQVTDVFGTMPMVDGPILGKLEDGASGRIDALGIAVIYCSYNNSSDFLQILALNPPGSAFKYRSITFANPDLASQFPGSRHLRSVAGQNWIEGTELRIYGGKAGDTPTSHYDLFALDFVNVLNGGPPIARVVSTNTLPPGQRCEGECLIAMRIPAWGGVLVCDGTKANWLDYASMTWSLMTVTNPSTNRVAPFAGGSAPFCAYSPAQQRGVVLWANGAIETMTLSTGNTPIDPPPPPPPIDPPPTNLVNTIVGVTPGGVIVGTCKVPVTHVFLNFDGSQVQGAADIHPPGDGTWRYQLPQSFFDGQEHSVYGRANDGATEVYLDNAPKSAPYTFRLPTGGTPTGPFVPMPPADNSSSGTPTPEQPGTGGGGGAPPPTSTALIPLQGNRTITTTAFTLPDAIRQALYGKHHGWANVGTDWYLQFGDHKSDSVGEPVDSQQHLLVPDADDGNQQRYKINWATMVALKIQNYFKHAVAGVDPDTVLQGALPDDGGVCSRRREVITFPSERVDQSPTRTTTLNGVVIEGCTERSRRLYGANIAVQNMDSIYATNVDTGVDRILLTPRPHCMRGDKMWRPEYDPVNDFCFALLNNGGDCSFFKMGFDANDSGVDITNYNPGTNVPAKLNWDSTGLGQITAHVAGLAINWVTRIAYFYDHITTRMYSISVDGIFHGNEIPKLLCEFVSLGEPLLAGDQSTIKCAWYPGIGVVYNGINSIIVYEPDSNKATRQPRQDGWIGGNGNRVPTQTLTFDNVGVRKLVSVGGIDNQSDVPIQNNQGWFIEVV